MGGAIVDFPVVFAMTAYCSLVLCSVGPLLWYHVGLIRKNLTTNEQVCVLLSCVCSFVNVCRCGIATRAVEILMIEARLSRTSRRASAFLVCVVLVC